MFCQSCIEKHLAVKENCPEVNELGKRGWEVAGRRRKEEEGEGKRRKEKEGEGRRGKEKGDL